MRQNELFFNILYSLGQKSKETHWKLGQDFAPIHQLGVWEKIVSVIYHDFRLPYLSVPNID